MSIVKMKRLRLIALNEQKDDLLASLLRVGCVEVTEPEGELSDPEWASLVRKDESGLLEIKARANALSAALDALKKYAPGKFGLFEIRSEITEKALFDDELLSKELATAEIINETVRDIAQNYSKEGRVAAQKASVTPWQLVDWPLDQESTESTDILFGVCPKAVNVEEVQDELEKAAPESEITLVASDKEQQYLMAVSYREATERVLEVLRVHGFSAVHFKDLPGTAVESIARLDEKLEELRAQRREMEQKIVSYKDERQALKVCLDRLTQDISKESTRERFLVSGSVFFMEGWARVDGLAKLEKELEGFCCAYDLEDPQEGEVPPTVCQNSKLVDPMHMVVEMYSLPAYNGIDPHPLIFPFFVFYFGFMFADMGYGLIITLVSLAVLKRYKPKKTIGYMFRMGVQIGIMTMICGFFIGSLFGDAITVFSENFMSETRTLWALVDPLEDPMTILYFGIILGVFQMLFGMCVKLYMGFRDGEGLEACLDVIPWWVMFAGIGGTVLTGSIVPILIGVVALVATQGRHADSIPGKIFGGVASLYDITSWLGDILSYARLMALMLATTVIASVVNILGTLPGNVFIFVVVFVIGHVFNLGINLIGTYVHAARLQYLEFFGKFYKDGGIPFRPLAYDTKYVDVVEEEQAS